MYINNITNKEILHKHEVCTVQPYLSGNYQLDLLLRNHNWAGGINSPVALTYKISLDKDSPFDLSKQEDWSEEFKEAVLALLSIREYLQSIGIYQAKLVDYIEDDDNRDAYQLYENNFESSFAKVEYMAAIYLENIKYSIESHPDHELAQKISPLLLAESIYDLDLNKLNIPVISSSDKFVEDEELVISKEFVNEKLSIMVNYIFNVMSEVANINFQEVENGEQISIYAPINDLCPDPRIDWFFTIENFNYSDGKTHHVSLEGNYCVNNEITFSKMDFASLLHGLGHMVIDHPNDANIAIRENILPLDHDWSNRDEDYGIASEYRADNGCMSVMAFTACFYQGKKFDDVLTYMPIDIQAMQHIYGRNEYTRVGDTSYILTNNQTFVDDIRAPMLPINLSEQYHYKNSFSIEAEVKRSIYTLYDAGGINNFDLSHAQKAEIDLNEGAGHFNVIGNNVFLIAYGTHIHNIVIGSGDIKITLNLALNHNITIPAEGGHVVIENFTSDDNIILADNANQDLEFIGCIKPYSNIGDNQTEICFE